MTINVKKCLQRIYFIKVYMQNILKIHSTQYPKNPNNPIRKWTEGLNRHFFQGKHTDCQQIHENAEYP